MKSEEPTADNVAHLKLVQTPEAEPEPVGVTDSDVQDLDSMLIVGFKRDGDLYIRSSRNVTRKDALWLIEVARANVLGIDYE